VHGNTGENNNVCIEYPNTDLRLKLWAKWRLSGNDLRVLGYPGSSSHTKPSGGKGFINPDIPDNPEAELIDRLVGELSRQHAKLYLVFRSCYIYHDNGRDGCVNCCISLKTYQKNIKKAVEWIHVRLN